MPKQNKIDLHCHSKYSDKPLAWFLNRVNSPECWTEPEALYESALARGMDLVTITDHDRIEGGLEILHHGAHVFLSVEVSAVFPENGCIVHVLALNISEAQHQEMQLLRYNIYDLVTYLRAEGITHVLAHPYSGPNERLTPELVEKCFLLFKNWELLNGPRDPYHAEALQQTVDWLTRARLEAWAEKYDIEPISLEPSRHWTGGSDDHSGHTVGRCITTFDGQPTVEALCQSINHGTCAAEGETMSVTSYSHCILHGTFKWFNSNQVDPDTDLFCALRASLLNGQVPDFETAPVGGILQSILKNLQGVAAESSLPTRDDLMLRANTEEVHEKIFKIIGTVLNRTATEISSNIVEQYQGLRLFELIHEIPKLVELAYFCVPYMFGYNIYFKDRKCPEHMARAFGLPCAPPNEPRVAIFTDTIDSVNGVSLSLRRLADQLNLDGHFVKILGLRGQQRDAIQSEEAGESHVIRFDPLTTFPLQGYEDMELGVPPLFAMLNWAVENRISLIQASTPGPMGIAALMVSRLLGIRFVGNYHTQVPEYAERLTGQPFVGRLARAFVRWFYGTVEKIIVATHATREYLIRMGLPADQIQVVARGVDVNEFSPKHRSKHVWESYGLNGSTKLLYVGRVSKEKNVDELFNVLGQLRSDGVDVELAIVGDGPYRQELQAHASSGVAFTGFLEGESLARAYASADLFVFPSTTDTFGNAVLEAQASGLPAIVTDEGGPSELIEHNRTGFIVPAGDTKALASAIKHLADNPKKRAEMSGAARRKALGKNYQSAAHALWDTYQQYATNDTMGSVPSIWSAMPDRG